MSRGRTGRRPSLTASHERVCLASTSSPGSGSCPSSGKRYDAERRVLRRGAVRLEEVGQTVHGEADADKMLFSNYRFRCLFALRGWRPWRGRGLCILWESGFLFQNTKPCNIQITVLFPKEIQQIVSFEAGTHVWHLSQLIHCNCATDYLFNTANASANLVEEDPLTGTK